MYTVYFFTKGSSFCQSYYSQMPFLFYGLLIAYSAMLIFYSKACRSPGFVKDEIVNNSEVGDSENHDSNTFFCKYCQIYVPIRASHCLTCNKCIIRLDHHCPWTNNCIGRDNHFYFFIFTSLAFISEIIPQIDASMHFYFYSTNSNRHNDFFRVICAYVPFIAAPTFGSVFTGNLYYQSILTISKNATYWERSRRARISYMKGLPFGYSPFDKGLIENIIEFCTMKEKKMKWTIKPHDISLFSNELLIITQNQGERLSLLCVFIYLSLFAYLLNFVLNNFFILKELIAEIKIVIMNHATILMVIGLILKLFLILLFMYQMFLF